MSLEFHAKELKGTSVMGTFNLLCKVYMLLINSFYIRASTCYIHNTFYHCLTYMQLCTEAQYFI